MSTYKNLGCRMIRQDKGAGWRVEGPGLNFSGDGNKGTVMSNALADWARDGRVALDKVKGWHKPNGQK